MSRIKSVFFLLFLLLSIGSLIILTQLKKAPLVLAQTAPEPFLFESTSVFLKFSDIVISINGQQIPFQPAPGSYNYANVKINPNGIPFNNPLYREIELAWNANGNDMYVLFFAHRYAQSDKWRVYQIQATDGNGLTFDSRRYFEGFETIPYSAKYEKTVTLTQQGESPQPMTLTFTNLELDVFMDQPEVAIGTCPMLPPSGFPLELPAQLMNQAIDKKIDGSQSTYTLDENSSLGVIEDGYFMIFSFTALKGQSFQTLTTEVPYRSFVRTHLYDRDGKRIIEGDTRLTTTALYTGKYYLLVKSFVCRSGQFVLELSDIQQKSISSIYSISVTAQTPNGISFFNRSGNITFPKNEYQLLVDFGKIDTFNPDNQRVSWSVRKEGTTELLSTTVIPLVRKNGVEVPLYIQQLSSSTLLITPIDNYYFADDSSYTFNLNYPFDPSRGYAVTITPRSPQLNMLCRSDINQDRLVDITDYSILVRNFFEPITANACQ